MKLLKQIPFVLLCLIAVAFSIKGFREPDLWWQIRTGQWILEHGQMPHTDMFSYTFTGKEWINIKWGFEVLAALVVKFTAPECVFIIQALCSVLLVFFLLKTAKLFQQNVLEKVDELSALVLYLSLFILLIGIEYRIIGRPEIVSHLMTVLFVYLLYLFRFTKSGMVWLLVPLQLVWANMHEAFGIGIVLVFLFAVGEWFEYFFSKNKEKSSSAKTLSILLFACIAITILNPNGLQLLLRPFNILGQVYSNKYTSELADATTIGYWKKEPFIASFFLLVSILTIAWSAYKQKGKQTILSTFIKQYGIVSVLLCIAFAYLGFTAYRNVVFLLLVTFPFFVVGVTFVLNQFGVTKIVSFLKSTFANVLLVLFLLFFYTAIVSNKYYEWTESRDRFGLEVLSSFNPTGAANYIKQHNIKGKCFADYLTSSYLLYALQPDFRTYIDLRDLDIFPPSFFKQFMETVNYEDEFRHTDSIQHFDYVVLYRPQFPALHNYLFNSPNYRLVFMDGVAAVYLKMNTAAAKDSITKNIFTPFQPQKVSGFASAINHLLNPFYSPVDYRSYNQDLITASYYLQVGALNLALNRANKAVQFPAETYQSKELLGQVYLAKAGQEQNDTLRNEFIQFARNNFLASLAENEKYANANLSMGALLIQQQSFAAALDYFDKCLAAEPANLQAHVYAAECCKHLAEQNSSEATEQNKQAILHFLQAHQLDPENPSFTFNLGILYFKTGDCKNSIKFLNLIKNLEGITPPNRKIIDDCLHQCGS